MTQGLGIMSHKFIAKVATSIVASLIITSGFSITANAEPIDNDIINAAAQLGLLRAVPQQNFQRQQQNRQRTAQQANRRVQTRRPDPYAARRLQIQHQNQNRRKARHTQLQRQVTHRNNLRRASQRSTYRGNTSNIWGRIYQGYRIKNYNHKPEVKRFINKFARSPQSIQRLTDRSSDYLYLVVSQLNRRGMPTELAYLPYVESAYRNKAYSHAGAAGMWQFIPATGRRYGLKQTRSYDARLDPHQSTQAALSYLQKLHREFRGDWLLALAAYNCGENRVQREIAKNMARGLPTDYWNLDLPRETKQYVPRLLAYKEILSRPSAYGVRIKGIPNAPALARIHVNKPVNLRKAAAHAGLPAKQLLTLNSGYLHGITTPLFSNSIILPRSHASVLNQVIRNLPPAADVHRKSARKKYKGRRSRRGYVRYRVRSGDNLYQIARKHGTTVKKIKRLNRINGNRIKPGISLIIAKSRRSRKTYS